MKSHLLERGDPPAAEWQAGYTQRIDAMFTLAHDDQWRLILAVGTLAALLERFCRIHAVEYGHVLRNNREEPIEHFGYVDGISQPVFLTSDLPADKPVYWDAGEPLKRVLVPDLTVPGVPDAFGSFLVFRKLEQNVRGFQAGLETLARTLNAESPNLEWAEGMVIGRFRDGTPLTQSKRPTPATARANDFEYPGTPHDWHCPFHAHIRKANPRNDRKADAREHRIARRGIPYDDRWRSDRGQEPHQLPSRDVGLLFMCFQASIANQFAFIQSRWANSGTFAQPDTGRDPLVGQPFDQGSAQQWTARPYKGRPTPYNFGGFVTLRGGEFLFAPSIPFLLNAKAPA
jgi:Dyp-type peroxidase family